MLYLREISFAALGWLQIKSEYFWKRILLLRRRSKFVKYVLVLFFVIATFCSPQASYLVNIHAEIVLTDSDLEIEVLADLPRATGTASAMAFLGQDDILLLAQEGKVYRILNGDISHNPVLELDVDSEGERGLLGIAVANASENEGNKGQDNPRYVFLYYTEKVQRTNDHCTEECERNEILVNRLYRYEFVDDRLTNARMLVEIPVGSGESLSEDGASYRQHFGGAITIGPDNNIYLVTGDGGICHRSCQKAVDSGFLNAQTANKRDGDQAVGRGGILYLTQDGEPADPVLGNDYPLNLYYAYGIRNSFGIDFDPVTGILWDTENGPAFGDEINLVEPGFNSGWAKIQGEWIIHNYTQLEPIALKKGYFYSSASSYDNNLEDFNGEGRYSDPEFIWNSTVGVTSLKFFSSDKLGEQYENDIFVGAYHLGLLYRFNLDEGRRNLLLEEPLTDKVANSEKELDKVVFGYGFNSIVDIEVGPDGYLYLLTLNGEILKIVPKEKKE
jgi:aldose sugar dehydrogenase